ncbi:MAG: ABC transporter substrate-binding protein [Pseudomonadales bacterium]
MAVSCVGIVRWSVLMLTLMFAGCGDRPAAGEAGGTDAEHEGSAPGLTRVILQTDWYPQPEHAGFYLASLAGWYQELGLEVEIRPGGFPGSLPQLVATNEVQFALGTSDNVLVARGRGIPLVSLLPYFQHDPQCVMFHKSAAITALSDLDGRRVMVNPGATYVAWMQQSLGIRLQLIPLDYSIARFLSDPDFVQQCFVTSEPWYVEQQGVEVGVLPLSTSGFDPYRVVYASDNYVSAHPDVVRAFVKASLRGWRAYAEGDFERVHARIAELNPGQTLPFMTWTREQMQKHGLFGVDSADGAGIGTISKTRVQTLIDQLDSLGLLEQPIKVEESFALDVVPDGLLVE